MNIFDQILKEMDKMGVKLVPTFIFNHEPEVYKLTIHYKDESEYHVKNARDIKILKHKSGGHDIEYSYTKHLSRGTEFGTEKSMSDSHVKTSTHDVIGITMETRKDNGVYRKEYVEVA